MPLSVHAGAGEPQTACLSGPKCCIIHVDQHLALHVSDRLLAPGGCTQPPVFLWLPSMDRVCIFMDGSNFYHALKEAGLPVNVDFGKLGTTLTGSGRRHIHTY